MRSCSYFYHSGCAALSQISPSCDAIPSTLRKCGPAALWEWRSCTPRLVPSFPAFGNATTTRTWPTSESNSGFHGRGEEGGDRDNLFYSLRVCQKKFTNTLWSASAVLCLPKATQSPVWTEGAEMPENQLMPDLPLAGNKIQAKVQAEPGSWPFLSLKDFLGLISFWWQSILLLYEFHLGD